MSLPWFRLYHRMIDDDKLRLLAFEDRWHFIALCCLKADGLLNEPDSDMRTRRIAVKMGVQLRELDEVGRRLREVGLVDDLLCPIAWDELQYQSDSSTSRVKRFRENKRLKGVKQGETLQKRSGNVLDTDTDTDTEIEPKGSRPSDDARELVEDWNALADELSLPRVVKLTDDRKRKIRAALKRNTLEEWREAFRAIRRSPFLRGEGRTGFRADFDFLLQPKSFARMIEGFYDGKVQ